MLQLIFLSQVIFVLSWGMLMYANEVEMKENEKLPEIKLNYNIHNEVIAFDIHHNTIAIFLQKDNNIMQFCYE